MLLCNLRGGGKWIQLSVSGGVELLLPLSDTKSKHYSSHVYDICVIILQCWYDISIKGVNWNMCSCAICADVSLSHTRKTQRTDTHTAAHTPAYMLICTCENVADAYHSHTWTHLKAQMHSNVYSYRDSPAAKAVQMCVLNCTGCSATHERLSRRLGDRCSTLVQARFQTCTHTHTQLRTLFICQ